MYEVLQMIQSLEVEAGTDEKVNPPVDVSFYKGDDKAKAISAMASAIADCESPYYKVMNVRVIITD